MKVRMLGRIATTFGSSMCPAKCASSFHAVIAQLVERNLAKVEAAGSSPAYRSTFVNQRTSLGLSRTRS
jgi:hypothetical protein